MVLEWRLSCRGLSKLLGILAARKIPGILERPQSDFSLDLFQNPFQLAPVGRCVIQGRLLTASFVTVTEIEEQFSCLFSYTDTSHA